VAPVSSSKNKLSIPRLGLLAATIGARLFSRIKEDLRLSNLNTTLWTDSSTVLAWITREEQWDVFVRNRVEEIKQLTASCLWKHIPGIFNPADLPSRGCSVNQFIESRWWEGPVWLRKSEESWPVSHVCFNEQEI